MEQNKLKLVLPKGRIFKKVASLLNDIGMGIDVEERSYLPRVSDPQIEAKIMKPQNIPQLVELGSHDAGFTGLDWVTETGSNVRTVMDMGFDPVRIVAAVPEALVKADLKSRKIIVASEYEQITRRYLEEKGYNFVFVRTFGATEVFPPDDADMIVDNVSTGRTLSEHKLVPVDTVMSSSTLLIANPESMEDPWKSEKLGKIVTLFSSVLDARARVMLEMNVSREKMAAVIEMLPCMRAPTVSPLYKEEGFAVKAAVRREESAGLILKLKELGATDILEYEIRKVVV